MNDRVAVEEGTLWYVASKSYVSNSKLKSTYETYKDIQSMYVLEGIIESDLLEEVDMIIIFCR